MRDTVLISSRHGRNTQRLPSTGMAYSRGDTRQLRDRLRAEILRGGFVDGRLPPEAELMMAEGVSRATVRAALAELRHEGLIERTQGVGTHVVVRGMMLRLAEVHGVAPPQERSLLNRRLRPKILDHSVVPAPASVARRLDVAPGTDCLRLEYVALVGDEPMALATNYVLFPEAAAIGDTPFVSDWYALLDDARVSISDSEFVLCCAIADGATAEPLGLAAGAPLMVLEQVVHDASGRAFDLAFIHIRGDRFLLTSRIGRDHTGLY